MQLLRGLLAGAASRQETLERLLDHIKPAEMVEVGVWKGEFSAFALTKPYLAKFYMLDPWRQLPEWNKPFNKDSVAFDAVYAEAEAATRFAADRRVILRGTTAEVIHQIPDESLDLAYIDGDHTLRGVAIDLIATWGKIKPGGYLLGDDFVPSIWQHAADFEPTFVFPFACYFAEAVGCEIAALGHGQFIIPKVPAPYQFHDFTGRYGKTALLPQLRKHL
ncbi:class I SAM-dependent methyltransferase [Rhodobacter sp. KR11]|uniref:class I SAM-dependent methyltransferase n=1 Tax=Rhodobacter sp. KR11 TaxID=2974588 RepID=UPI00222158FA|nr:class I SAM-dependent methyltransferase [Rhodobacter sp. KR11]MCW1919272.1 class I SAM-dependent methyltransferase [Rhodobacter sp. KR11]